MHALRQALASVLEIASSQIDDLDDETMLVLTQLLQQANERLVQMMEVGETEELEEAEAEQAELANEITPPAPPTPPTGGEIPPLEQAPHESSNVNALKYDPTKKELFVQFHGKYPQKEGSTYSYQGVEPNVFDIIRRGAVSPKTSGKNGFHQWYRGITPSHGASVNALLVKGKYQYQRLS